MHYAFATPVNEIEADEVLCEKCKTRIDDEAYYLDGTFYCEPCVSDLEDDAEIDAAAFAEENCRIVLPLPKYDPSQKFKCTPEEYEAGDKESYSPKAFLCHYRHACTNYDELIMKLDRHNPYDQILYSAIYSRVMKLIEEALGDDAYILMKDYEWDDSLGD